MARSTAQASKLEAKAIAAETKSKGMRMLFEAGYTVAQVAKIFGVGYPFAYGVAKRGGFAQSAAGRRPVKAQAKAARSTKATAAKVTKVAPRAARAKATTTVAKKPGRPTTARRAANRKARVSA